MTRTARTEKKDEIKHAASFFMPMNRKALYWRKLFFIFLNFFPWSSATYLFSCHSILLWSDCMCTAQNFDFVWFGNNLLFFLFFKKRLENLILCLLGKNQRQKTFLSVSLGTQSLATFCPTNQSSFVDI